MSKRALPDEYRQLNPSSRSHVYPFSPMVSVASFSPHSSLAIPTYAPSSLGWSATHQVPSVSFHDSVFDNLGSVCAAEVAISNAATLVRSKLCARRVTSRTPAPSRRANTRTTPKVVSEAQAILFCRRHQPRRPPIAKIRPGKGGLFSLEIGCRLGLLCAAKLSPKPTRERLHDGNKKGQHQISSDRKAKPQSSISVLLHCQT